ncbi:reverse transcriptase [Teladorsagia circumcincta]|uniref:RNA-directed DNA polymerase n=1 Tax=Teladorsagia circumcincta TaxID=45464 RepID=A0A2G9UY33_TELCI|nr:reverse transcriptase [Teladorsagia circumcincta]
MAEFNDVSPEQMKCLELAAEIQQFLNIRQDAALPERSASTHINAVDSQSRKREPPSPCFRCGAHHWSKDCPFLNKTFHDCGNSGHERILQELQDEEEAEAEKKAENSKQRRHRLNTCRRRFNFSHLPPVQNNGKTIRIRLDTGADVTLLSHADWIAIGRPTLQSPQITLRLLNRTNDALEQHQHPLPTPDDIFTKLNGGRYFSQLDLAEAYLQLEVDDDSKQLLTINTHQGLYRFNRLPFGVKPASGILQQCIDALIAGLDGNAAYLDDILVTGRTIDEHNTRLDTVFQRIQDYGFRVRLEKCSFLQTQIKYLGFVINAHGRRPDPDKVKAIQKMPTPRDVSQLRAFLGLINFYRNFVKNLHNLRAPLDALTKKDAVYTWTLECQSSFDKIKAILNSDLLLTHYDPNLPIIVAADASNYGIGATLSHRFPDGSEKVVYHASRCLTPAQKNYSQIEKEALALIFAVQKFHRFGHGRHFTLKTDHKPLVAIFGNKKGIPVYSANRLQRWAAMLLNYDFAIEYVNTKDFGQVDALSLLIASHSSTPEDFVIANVDVDVTAET